MILDFGGDKWARLGQEVRLSCSAIGAGALRYRWMLPNLRERADASSELVVERVSEADFGSYSCQVVGQHGSDTIYYVLRPISARLFLFLLPRCFALSASAPLYFLHIRVL